MSEAKNYNDGNWHGWNGGECPVHPETIVEVVLFDDTNPDRSVDSWNGATKPRAGDFYGGWEYKNGYRHVIAFRVVKEYREPREFWLSLGIVFLTEEDARKQFPDAQPLHVREVLE